MHWADCAMIAAIHRFGTRRQSAENAENIVCLLEWGYLHIISRAGIP